ncbi:hypothetical protein CBS115989_1632 [Aspergillus niger]|nr:hypothetical protein CBS115989_1632 [Aspergillus niger]KAI2846326.1 hypothetical protein CBS11350_3866 [Aspergillus niger]KAI2855706.1 hypothetical protein CBS11232_4175 [Aspergillus niger]KAI2880500.1 hypothetical protein CBS115988_1589 [Aspergillus niger]KAI2910356.1 hypothetical protein CBS147371_9008 [Aspergillus niger]
MPQSLLLFVVVLPFINTPHLHLRSLVSPSSSVLILTLPNYPRHTPVVFPRQLSLEVGFAIIVLFFFNNRLL